MNLYQPNERIHLEKGRWEVGVGRGGGHKGSSFCALWQKMLKSSACGFQRYNSAAAVS